MLFLVWTLKASICIIMLTIRIYSESEKFTKISPGDFLEAVCFLFIIAWGFSAFVLKFHRGKKFMGIARRRPGAPGEYVEASPGALFRGYLLGLGDPLRWLHRLIYVARKT